MLAHRLEHVLDRNRLPAKGAGQDRAAINENRRHVEAADQQTVVKYLERAKELRKKARLCFDLETKHALLNEAIDFECLAAEIAENLADKK